MTVMHAATDSKKIVQNPSVIPLIGFMKSGFENEIKWSCYLHLGCVKLPGNPLMGKVVKSE